MYEPTYDAGATILYHGGRYRNGISRHTIEYRPRKCEADEDLVDKSCTRPETFGDLVKR